MADPTGQTREIELECPQSNLMSNVPNGLPQLSHPK